MSTKRKVSKTSKGQIKAHASSVMSRGQALFDVPMESAHALINQVLEKHPSVQDLIDEFGDEQVMLFVMAALLTQQLQRDALIDEEGEGEMHSGAPTVLAAHLLAILMNAHNDPFMARAPEQVGAKLSGMFVSLFGKAAGNIERSNIFVMKVLKYLHDVALELTRQVLNGDLEGLFEDNILDIMEALQPEAEGPFGQALWGGFVLACAYLTVLAQAGRDGYEGVEMPSSIDIQSLDHDQRGRAFKEWVRIGVSASDAKWLQGDGQDFALSETIGTLGPRYCILVAHDEAQFYNRAIGSYIDLNVLAAAQRACSGYTSILFRSF